MAFTITSGAFHDGGPIPVQYTCEGADTPPPLDVSEPPEGTLSYALVMDDPDAPSGTFTHWLAYDIPVTRTFDPGAGTTLRNSFGRHGYGGPCPPPGHGPHRYYFTLHALGVPSLTLRGDTRKDLEEALGPHSRGTARLMGRYERIRR
jgi:Raf kinase inhibitor-like YbhB/YbcL family protein